MGRRGELQVPWCLAGAVVVLRRRGRSPVVLCAGELGRGTEAEAAGARPRVQPAARRCHAGQLGQQRVPRAPAPHAGALAADHSDQPYHLFYEGFRPPRGSIRGTAYCSPKKYFSQEPEKAPPLEPCFGRGGSSHPEEAGLRLCEASSSPLAQHCLSSVCRNNKLLLLSHAIFSQGSLLLKNC